MMSEYLLSHFTRRRSIFQVHKAFLEIARTEGQKSQDKKKALINKLLVAAGQNEAGYIMRCLQVGGLEGKLHLPPGLGTSHCC